MRIQRKHISETVYGAKECCIREGLQATLINEFGLVEYSVSTAEDSTPICNEFHRKNGSWPISFIFLRILIEVKHINLFFCCSTFYTKSSGTRWYQELTSES